jgi:hypothetical protein
MGKPDHKPERGPVIRAASTGHAVTISPNQSAAYEAYKRLSGNDGKVMETEGEVAGER